MSLTRYNLTGDGMRIFGSREYFNRVLYGGHGNDAGKNRFFTFAGDTPLFTGASTDYSRHTWCYQAKNGLLLSGLALTPGVTLPGIGDGYSGWFHQSSDVITTWKHGYMEYRLTRFSPYFPDVEIAIEAYPLIETDGFLIHYRIQTDQRVIFCAGFGGITDFIGRFEYHHSPTRNFKPSDCEGNSVEIGENNALLKGPNRTAMLVGTSFKAEFQSDAAAALAEPYPSGFLTGHEGTPAIVKIVRPLESGEQFDGNIIVLRNAALADLRRLAGDDPRKQIKRQIRAKYSDIDFHTPNDWLNQTVPDMVMALDASWHGKTFYHGAVGYHAPFLGWRGWYAPSLFGWKERVATAIRSHFDTMITKTAGPEKVWYDGADRPDLDHEGTQYHHLENSSGFLPALLHRNDIYNMQEVALDMTLHYLNINPDLELGAEIFARLAQALDWEERILDPDGDGLYQNFLNTWISDGHSYNGAGCAQASFYNYAANRDAAALGRKLGRDTGMFERRCAKITAAVQSRLWLEKSGVMAESVDTIGNKLLHPSPELSTVYLALDCGCVDQFQAYRMLKFTERSIKSVSTPSRRGRLAFSSNWLPKKYSTCGIFPAENACLALAYFQNGQCEKAMEIINGLTDAYYLSHNPGSIRHVLTTHGGGDSGDIDFTDVTSTYMRLLIEGMWGIRYRLLEDKIFITPQLPDDWDHAELMLPDMRLSCRRNRLEDILSVDTEIIADKLIRIPVRYAEIEDVLLNGEPVTYQTEPGIGVGFLQVETELTGRIEIRVCYGTAALPNLVQPRITLFAGNIAALETTAGRITELKSPMPELPDAGNARLFEAVGEPGIYDVFALAEYRDAKLWLPAEIEVRAVPIPVTPLKFTSQQHLELTDFFNCAL
ncbi:MAG: hypothetical protein PHV59_05005, partial [Victivallales bacterium]|nr:hypothetical protein [Victivallales bacterium]